MKDYICLEKILENYPECMIDRHQFVAVLSDFFPKDQITKNLILSVYDSDICVELATFGDISRANIDRYIRILKDNYKIESKQARKALNIWIDALNLMPANKRESIINTLYYCNTADNFHEKTTINNIYQNQNNPKNKLWKIVLLLIVISIFLLLTGKTPAINGLVGQTAEIAVVILPVFLFLQLIRLNNKKLRRKDKNKLAGRIKSTVALIIGSIIILNLAPEYRNELIKTKNTVLAELHSFTSEVIKRDNLKPISDEKNNSLLDKTDIEESEVEISALAKIEDPTLYITPVPTVKPTATPAVIVTAMPSVKPTVAPVIKATTSPTATPTRIPVVKATAPPVANPTTIPAATPIITQDTIDTNRYSVDIPKEYSEIRAFILLKEENESKSTDYYNIDRIIDLAKRLPEINGFTYETGTSGGSITTIQNMLASLGHLSSYAIDGIYGDGTAKAIKSFQAAVGLEQTGKADILTQFYLVMSAKNVEVSKTKESTIFIRSANFAVVLWEDGNSYIGMMESGNKLYRGTYIYNNGDYYAGSFRNNLRADEGKAYFTNGDIYDGNWKEDKMNGLGVYYFGGFSTGEKYDGYWVNNRMEGNGTYTTAQGYIITGIWENNKHKSW